MGGYGSTRWEYHQKKKLVEDCLHLDILNLSKRGLISGSYAHGTSVWENISGGRDASIEFEIFPVDYLSKIMRFHYTAECDGNERKMQYDCRLVSSKAFLGRSRWWFTCPLIINDQHCNRRVRKLYLPMGEIYFGCRHCHDLTYRSSQNHDKQVDELLSLSHEQLLSMIQEGSMKSKFLAIKALEKKFGL